MSMLSRTAVRRLVAVGIAVIAVSVWLLMNPANYQKQEVQAETPVGPTHLLAVTVLGELEVADHYTETKYNREDFYKSWTTVDGCDMRNVILQRDLVETVLDGCVVESGVLHDPYTGETIHFKRGAGTSSAVQIDHVVALSNSWATGAHRLEKDERHALSQDPLNLIAADGPANQKKSDKDASEWLPSNVGFQCQYVARQISVKRKYVLWVTVSEKAAMERVLDTCPHESTVGLEEVLKE